MKRTRSVLVEEFAIYYLLFTIFDLLNDWVIVLFLTSLPVGLNNGGGIYYLLFTIYDLLNDWVIFLF